MWNVSFSSEESLLSISISNKSQVWAMEYIYSRKWKAFIGSRDATTFHSSWLSSTTADGTHRKYLRFSYIKTDCLRSQTGEVRSCMEVDMLVCGHWLIADLNISFDPSPDYPGIATAAGKAWGATVTTQNELDPAIKEATEVVQGGKCAVIEVSWVGYTFSDWPWLNIYL